MQIAVCLADVAHRRGDMKLAQAALQTTLGKSRPSPLPTRWLGDALLPLSWPVTHSRFEAVDEGAERYVALLAKAAREGPATPDLPAGSLALAFASRRSRHAFHARKQFELERAHYGDEWDPFGTPEVGATVIAEMAGLVGEWSPTTVGVDLLVASSSLRAAVWLWFDDDDRSLTVMRTALESIARSRTHRTNPDAYARLVGSPKATLASWADASAWQHLRALAGALGEYSHVSERSRWTGARNALVAHAMHRDRPEAEARRNVLEVVVALLGEETTASLETLDPLLADAWRASIEERGLMDVSASLAHIGSQLSTFPFGAPDQERADDIDPDWAFQYSDVAVDRTC